MTECKSEGCTKVVGKNGRSGMCQKCYRSSNAAANASRIAESATPKDTQSGDGDQSTPPISLSQLHDLPTAPFTPFVNTSFKTKDADYVVVSEVQPQSMDEMFAMIIQMKEDYNLQLKKRDEAIASLSLCVSELQE